MTPDLSYEETAWAEAHGIVAGVDEVGRGPLAGPVTAAAVVLDRANIPEGLNDSKKLSQAKREALAEAIHTSAQVAIIHVSVEEIDALNILRASHLAMERALAQLPALPGMALIDGNRMPVELPCAGRTIVKGDGKSLSIAAASIVAKVARDRLMVDLAQQHPGYGWETNAGYPTAVHKKALRDLGVTPHHRRSFAPVRNILYQGNSTSL
ncbi:ribonuclease HII [Tropicimonas sp. TH_r6]|uniref:ribonuclease HII n=1 Tax=Tropicimonas sp. TH_r6 TaxID=3082085 RepID=UPI002953D155|nr:ribonuclease HII [Tropicimonas sp. TH_r6]MDV7144687.1 ribonuclease HII [Tropicimonas sp. TH_r6]